MPGRALELSLAGPVIAESFGFWTRVGFTPAEAGDAWSHPYGVVSVPGLSIGLHGLDAAPPMVTLMRADVAGLLPEFETRDIPLDELRVGPDVFNEVRFRDPAGLAVRIVEARTFSPPAVARACQFGRFEAFSWPCSDPEAVAGFWSRLLVDIDEPADGWALLTADLGGLPIAWHAPGTSKDPLLVFRHGSLPAVHDALTAQGAAPVARPLGIALPHLHWRTTDGIRIVVLA